jgi:hypothetical protein
LRNGAGALSTIALPMIDAGMLWSPRLPPLFMGVHREACSTALSAALPPLFRRTRKPQDRSLRARPSSNGAGGPTGHFLIGDAAELCRLSRSDEVRAMPATSPWPIALHRTGTITRARGIRIGDRIAPLAPNGRDHASARERQGKNQTRCAPSAGAPSRK